MPAPASIPVGAAAPNDGGWGSISSKGRQYAEPWHGVLDVTSWPWANRSGWQPRSQPCTRRWVLFPRLRSVPWLGMGCGEPHRAMPYIHCGSICAFAIKMIIANILKSRCTNSPLPNGVGFKPKQFLEGSGGNLFKARAILEKKKKENKCIQCVLHRESAFKPGCVTGGGTDPTCPSGVDPTPGATPASIHRATFQHWGCRRAAERSHPPELTGLRLEPYGQEQRAVCRLRGRPAELRGHSGHARAVWGDACMQPCLIW